MPKTDVKTGDQVRVYVGRISPRQRDDVIAFIRLHGQGPFEVRGVGPTAVALALPDERKCRNIPRNCVVRSD